MNKPDDSSNSNAEPKSSGLSARQLASQRLSEAQATILGRIKSDALWWLRNATKTYDPHWAEHGFESPYNPFPQHEYLDYVFDFLKPEREVSIQWVRDRLPADPWRGARERIIEKSRTMLGTWACVGFFTHAAITVPGREFLFQSQTAEKAEELISMAKTLWFQQDDWLKREFPLDRRLDDLPRDLIRWKNASRIVGIPSDPDKVRSYHPTGMLIDEAAFISEFKRNRETAIPACKVLVMLSSAGPSEFGDFICN